MRFEIPPVSAADAPGESMAADLVPQIGQRAKRSVPGLLLLALAVSLGAHGAAIAGLVWIIKHVRSRPPSVRYMVVAMVDLGGWNTVPGGGTAMRSGNMTRSRSKAPGSPAVTPGSASRSRQPHRYKAARNWKSHRRRPKPVRAKAIRSLPTSGTSSGEATRGGVSVLIAPTDSLKTGSHAERTSKNRDGAAANGTVAKAVPFGNAGSGGGADTKGAADIAGSRSGGAGKAGAGSVGAPGAGGFAVAQYASNPRPAYPEEARRAGEQGTVLLRVLVGTDGSPWKVEIARSCGFTILDRAAADAVRERWRFRPASAGTGAVQSWVLVPIRFRLNSNGE